MKNICTIILSLFLLSNLTSCEEAGVSRQETNGNEKDLPEELKGLKVYSVSTGGGSWVKVAILDGKVNSTTYKRNSGGKSTQTTILIDKRNNNKVIEITQVLMENDSIIVCRK